MAAAAEIIQSFRQGIVENGGNCAAIAVIKAAIDVFGVGGVFQHDQTVEGHQVVLRDGTCLTFTAAQLQHTAKLADFHLRTGADASQSELFRSIYDYANLCFCTMVKRVTQIGEAGDGIGEFEEAIVALNDGAITPQLPHILGLAAETLPFLAPTSGRGGCVAWSGGHAVFASHGVYDHWGEVRTMGLKYPRRLQITKV
jgi:hypothetical protein